MSGDLDGHDDLTADEPLDLAAVREDDALVEAISRGETPDGDDELAAMLVAWAASAQPEPARPGRVHVVLTPPEAWPPRVDPAYRVWRDQPLPEQPADPFVVRTLCMVSLLLCALCTVIWAAPL